jgi:hypothetical protein
MVEPLDKILSASKEKLVRLMWIYDKEIKNLEKTLS